MDIGSAIDLAQEGKRLAKRIKGVEAKLAPLRATSAQADYETNVPETVRNATAEKIAAYEGELASLEARTVMMASLSAGAQ
jgi:valyl-tRNA synthetase